MGSLKRACEEDFEPFQTAKPLQSALRALQGARPSTPKQPRSSRHLIAVPSSDDGKHRRLEERLVALDELQAEDLPELLNLLADRTLAWSDAARRLRSAALLLTYVARASGACCADFELLGGLTLLGEVLQEAVTSLQSGAQGSAQEDADMRILACLKCLQSLQLKQAPAGEEIAANLLKLRTPSKWAAAPEATNAASPATKASGLSVLSKRAAELCQRWRLKPPQSPLEDGGPSPRAVCFSPLACGLSPVPPSADVATPLASVATPFRREMFRTKATELIAQGFLGTTEGAKTAEKVEVALFCLHGAATAKYRQHARMLKSNLALPGNSELRARLLTGDLAVEELVSMDSNALAPEALQEERRAGQQKVLRLAVIPGLILPMDLEDEDDAPALLRVSAASRVGGA